jgi:hypothetical protein
VSKFVHSFSATKKYKQCPDLFYKDRVLRLYPFVQGEAAKRGDAVHLAMANFIGRSILMPPELEWLLELAKAVKAMPGKKYVEQKLGVTKDFRPCEYFDDAVYSRCVIDLLRIEPCGTIAHCLDWKGLALDTLIPTPSGFTTMGEVQVGDAVFDLDGAACKVTGKSQIKNLPCYRVTFVDGTQVVCDEEHLWRRSDGQVVLTPELGSTNASSIPVSKALQTQEAELPVAPYTLGLWLADGKHTSGEICKPYPEVWDNVAADGYTLSHSYASAKVDTRTVYGLHGALRNAGLLGNKHIPGVYLRASVTQRLALLRGLMDGDGCINKTRGQMNLTSIDRGFAEQVAHLIRTLGVRAKVHTVRKTGFGKTVEAYEVTCRTQPGWNIMSIAHKRNAEMEAVAARKLADHPHRVQSVELIDSVPTQCIKVDSPTSTFLCTDKYIPTHNTGKDSYPDVDQLLENAVAVFAHYPDVQRVKARLVFVDHDTSVPAEFDREYLEDYQDQIMADCAEIDLALLNEDFPRKKSPLCPWCPVTDCPNWSPPRKK